MKSDSKSGKIGRCRFLGDYHFSQSSLTTIHRAILLLTILCFLFSFALVAYAEGGPWVLTVEEKILRESEKMNVDSQLAFAIANCESGEWNKELGKKLPNPGAKNPNSTASGIFQFIFSTWKSTLERMDLPPTLDVFDADANIKAGVWLLKTDGIRHWEESRHCWGKIFSQIESVEEVEEGENANPKESEVLIYIPSERESSQPRIKINPFFYFIPKAFGWDGIWR